MTDNVTREVRSRIMSRIRSRDTGPEMEVRRAVHAAGFRYSLHPASLTGRPDMAFRGRRVAVFVNGCFWHRCPTCRPRVPKSNAEFWESKFRRNVERDAESHEALKSIGWRPFVIWECSIGSGIESLLALLNEGGRRV